MVIDIKGIISYKYGVLYVESIIKKMCLTWWGLSYRYGRYCGADFIIQISCFARWGFYLKNMYLTWGGLSYEYSS